MFLPSGLMKRGLCAAFLVVIILVASATLVPAKMGVSQVGGMPIVGPVVSVQVPLSTKSVIPDGKFTTPDEWSDTIANDLTIQCASSNCGTAPLSTLSGKAWLKHDNTWLYYLFQIDYTPPSRAPADWTGSGLEYWWGIIGNRYDYHNWYGVCPGLCFGEGFYDGTKNVYDPNSNMFQPPINQGFGTFSGNLYTFELKVLLNSGQALHWNLTPGKTYGVPGSDGLMFIYFSGLCVPKGSGCGTDQSGNPQTWDYYRSVTLSLLTTAISVQATTTSSEQTTASATTQTTLSSTAMTSEIVGQTRFGAIWLAVPVLAVIVVASILIVRRRKMSTTTVAVTEKSAEGAIPKLSL